MPLLLSAKDPAAIDAAAQRLAEGSLVGMPTETVYGLAADADNATAVHRIFEAKGRPADHPLIVHLAAGSGAGGWRHGVDHYAREVPAFAAALMQAFWPGPLTLILPRREGVAAVAAGGHSAWPIQCPGAGRAVHRVPLETGDRLRQALEGEAHPFRAGRHGGESDPRPAAYRSAWRRATANRWRCRHSPR